MRSILPKYTLFGRIGQDLSLYDTIEIDCEAADDHQYFFYIQPDNFSGMLYQTKIHTSRTMQTVRVPLQSLVATHNGYVMHHQSQMVKDNVMAVGFSLMQQPGPFSLRLKAIRAIPAVNYAP